MVREVIRGRLWKSGGKRLSEVDQHEEMIDGKMEADLTQLVYVYGRNQRGCLGTIDGCGCKALTEFRRGGGELEVESRRLL